MINICVINKRVSILNMQSATFRRGFATKGTKSSGQVFSKTYQRDAEDMRKTKFLMSLPDVT